MSENGYEYVRSGGSGFYVQQRGLISVWGKEAVQFLDGLISNNVKALPDGEQMLAAFPNAQGRLLAVVRVLRQGERFLFETEAATREKVFQNLFRFTFAGDFFVEDISDGYRFLDVINYGSSAPSSAFRYTAGGFETIAVPVDEWPGFQKTLEASGGVEIDDELYETLRIESGIRKYGVDMDETTIVPELGIDGLISYNKGCYIGQEIIARIHFRGHVAKQLIGLVLTGNEGNDIGSDSTLELLTKDGKNAGRVTSITFSPRLSEKIALAYVRFEYLGAGTNLMYGEGQATVTCLPF
ncbi:glycine cleavage T C-terminal barrel domain-containing protein [soil metagenome]